MKGMASVGLLLRSLPYRWFGLAALVLAIDQFMKHLAVTTLVFNEPVAIFPGFNLTLLYNYGIAFGLFNDSQGSQHLLLIPMVIFLTAGIGIWLAKLSRNEVWVGTALGLILGGALGNMWDRLYVGYVIDFVQLYVDTWYWPAFNFADAAICVGALMLIRDMFKAEEDVKEEDNNEN